MKVQWITHKGKKILCCDYSNIKDQDEMIRILKESIKEGLKIDDKVLLFSDMTKCTSGPDFMKELKEQGKKYAYKNDKSAVIGMSGLKKLLLNAYNLFANDGAEAFSTKEEALDYLVS